MIIVGELRGDIRRVRVNGRELEPGRSQRVWNHSPDGFNWGYYGSGPAQLALAILLDAGLSNAEAVTLHQKFKAHFLATQPAEGFFLDVDVLAWARQQATV